MMFQKLHRLAGHEEVDSAGSASRAAWQASDRISICSSSLSRSWAGMASSTSSCSCTAMGPGLGVGASALGRRGDQPRPAVRGVHLPLDQAVGVHPLDQRRDRVRIAGHAGTDLRLPNALAVVLLQPAQNGELVRRDPKCGQTLTKRLVQAVPAPPQQRGQPSAVRIIDRGLRGCHVRCKGPHDSTVKLLD